MPQRPDAFLSYTRFDDGYHSGAITELRRQLHMAAQAVTGRPFEIFQDIDGIGLGEPWFNKITDTIDTVTFFVPILTPSYFTSKLCCDELQHFLQREASEKRWDLILPIYYISCPVLEEKKLRESDRLAEIISGRQRWDWRELRHHSFRTKKVRLAVENLAEAIEKARRRDVSISPRPRSEYVTPARRRHLFSGASSDLIQQWLEVQTLLRAEFGDVTYRTWLSSLEVTGLEDGRVRLSVPTRFLRDWVAAHYSSAIGNFWRRVNPAIKGVSINVGDGLVRTTALQKRTPVEPGTVFRDIDAPWCPEIVVIRPGQFLMGSNEAERDWAIAQGAKPDWVEREKPQHLVRIAYPLAVGRYPVTFEEYGHFARSTGRAQPNDCGWGRGQRPVINVDWEDAKAFIAWLSVQTEQLYRLLSEAEWEYACRAGTTTRFWWGDDISPERANYGSALGGTSEVGEYPPNPFGLYDLHGNVWEWVEDTWHHSYEGAPDDGSVWTTGNNSRRALRGGSWSRNDAGVRSASRTASSTGFRESKIGFRVARAMTPRYRAPRAAGAAGLQNGEGSG